jgi:hypothetical protein
MFNFVDVEYDNMEEPSVVERNGQRFYKFPSVDDYYPSVTTVTGIRSRESIAKWRARVGEEEANRVSARASSRGSQFHAILEEHIKGTLDEQKYQKHPLALNMFKMARKTLGRVDNIHALETPLYSHLFGLAGRAAMFYERTGIKVKKIVTLIATEEGSIQVFQKYNLDDYLQLLKSYKDEFNALQNQG